MSRLAPDARTADGSPRCESACKKAPGLECTPRVGQIRFLELDYVGRAFRGEGYGQVPVAQHCLQAPGRRGIPRRRDAAWLGKDARRHAQPDPDLGDLGRSASGMVARPGFERLVAWLCAGEVGAGLCFDASRLARNGRDWHHLLELCGLVEARVID